MKKDTRYSTLTTVASRLRHQNLYSQRSALGDACATHVILWPASRHQNNFASKSLLRVEQDVGPQFDESSELTQFPQSSLDNTTQRQGTVLLPYQPWPSSHPLRSLVRRRSRRRIIEQLDLARLQTKSSALQPVEGSPIKRSLRRWEGSSLAPARRQRSSCPFKP